MAITVTLVRKMLAVKSKKMYSNGIQSSVNYASRKSNLMHAIDARRLPHSNSLILTGGRRAPLQTRAFNAVWPARRGRDGRGRPSFVLQSRRMSRTLQVMHGKADFSGDVCIDRSLSGK